MKNRLIELLKQRSCVYVICDRECGECHNVEMYDDAIESIADHLIANGVVIIDPVKYPPITNRGIIDQVMGTPLDEMADLIRAKEEGRIIVPTWQCGEEVWVIEYEEGEAIDVSCVQFLAEEKNFVIATAFINDYDIDETIEYHIAETQDNLDTDLKIYPKMDCFSTKEEAEKALAERRKDAEKGS